LRFILTGAREVQGGERRTATEEEAAQVWTFLETRLKFASSNALRPLFELYHDLTSEPFNDKSDEPHLTSVLHAVQTALWSNQLHFEVEAPFDALPELEWEPPPLKPKGPPAPIPSELWGRREAKETYIGIRLKDPNGDPITASRIRVKLQAAPPKKAKPIPQANSKSQASPKTATRISRS